MEHLTLETYISIGKPEQSFLEDYCGFVYTMFNDQVITDCD